MESDIEKLVELAVVGEKKALENHVGCIQSEAEQNFIFPIWCEFTHTNYSRDYPQNII